MIGEAKYQDEESGLMSKPTTIVCIQGHAAARDTILLNEPFYKKAECTLVGLHGNDSVVEWNNEVFERTFVAEKAEGKWCGYGLHPSRLIDGMRKAVSAYPEADSFLWTECDSIFLGPVPSRIPESFEAFHAGDRPPEWNCGEGPFVHPPFWMSRKNWILWLSVAAQLLGSGNGTTDVLAPMAAMAAGIPFVPCDEVWSTNGQDMRVASKMVQAKAMIETGVWHVHGVKRLDHLEFILGKTRNFPTDTLWF